MSITDGKLRTTGTIEHVIRQLCVIPGLGFGASRHRLRAIEDPASTGICPIAIMDAVEERVGLKKDVVDIEPLAVQVEDRYRLAGSDYLPGVSGPGLEVILFYQGDMAENEALRVLNFPVLQIDVRENKHLTKVNLIIVPKRLKGKDGGGDEQ